jgi:hypothetical protein
VSYEIYDNHVIQVTVSRGGAVIRKHLPRYYIALSADKETITTEETALITAKIYNYLNELQNVVIELEVNTAELIETENGEASFTFSGDIGDHVITVSCEGFKSGEITIKVE